MESFDVELDRRTRKEIDGLRAEVESLRRGGAELGRIIERHGRWIVEATDSADVIGEDGDGDWEVVWERLFGLAERAQEAEAENARLSRELKAAQSRCADMARYKPQRGEVKALREEVRVLRGQLRRVLGLHRHYTSAGGGVGRCAECMIQWPCPTMQALGVRE